MNGRTGKKPGSFTGNSSRPGPLGQAARGPPAVGEGGRGPHRQRSSASKLTGITWVGSRCDGASRGPRAVPPIGHETQVYRPRPWRQGEIVFARTEYSAGACPRVDRRTPGPTPGGAELGGWRMGGGPIGGKTKNLPPRRGQAAGKGIGVSKTVIRRPPREVFSSMAAGTEGPLRTLPQVGRPAVQDRMHGHSRATEGESKGSFQMPLAPGEGPEAGARGTGDSPVFVRPVRRTGPHISDPPSVTGGVAAESGRGAGMMFRRQEQDDRGHRATTKSLRCSSAGRQRRQRSRRKPRNEGPRSFPRGHSRRATARLVLWRFFDRSRNISGRGRPLAARAAPDTVSVRHRPGSHRWGDSDRCVLDRHGGTAWVGFLVWR